MFANGRDESPHKKKKKSVMRDGSRTPATSKMEIFVTIYKESVKISHK